MWKRGEPIPQDAKYLLLFRRSLGLDGFDEFVLVEPQDGRTPEEQAQLEWRFELSRQGFECGRVSDPQLIEISRVTSLE